MGDRELEGDDPAHTVPRVDRALEPELAGQPGEVVGEDAHCIVPFGLVAPAVAA
jgi:hypothetical protein